MIRIATMTSSELESTSQPGSGSSGYTSSLLQFGVDVEEVMVRVQDRHPRLFTEQIDNVTIIWLL